MGKPTYVQQGRKRQREEPYLYKLSKSTRLNEAAYPGLKAISMFVLNPIHKQGIS
jgi:hypothetical protein